MFVIEESLILHDANLSEALHQLINS